MKYRATFYQLINRLNLKTGIELGVAQGEFSRLLLKSKFEKLYLIDKWNDHHNTEEMINVYKKFKSELNRICIIRSLFEEALTLFENKSLDFIYIDGYAHTGQEQGKTLFDWYPKLKCGGIFAGHDYHFQWPKTIESVDKFIKTYNKKLHLTRGDYYPSWYIIK